MSGNIVKRVMLGVIALAVVGAIGALVGAIGGAVVTVTMDALFSISNTMIASSGIGALLGALAATAWMANVIYTHRGVSVLILHLTLHTSTPNQHGLGIFLPASMRELAVYHTKSPRIQ